jgi:mannosyltransferase OCH1-like enzyme
MTIPKKIHYCWFGGKELPDEYKKYMETWYKIMPDFEIKLWNEDNSPMHLPYMKLALEYRKWANLSNYVRLHAVYEEGGIYLDTDVQVIKSFTPLLNDSCFLGLQIEKTTEINSFNNAIFGAVPKHLFINKMKEALPALYDGKETAYLSSPHITTYLLNKEGYSGLQQEKVKDIQVYPREYFYPYSWLEKYSEDCITENTYAIHFWSGTWSFQETKNSIDIFKNRLKRIYRNK